MCTLYKSKCMHIFTCLTELHLSIKLNKNIYTLYKSTFLRILLSYPFKFTRIAVNSINMLSIKRIFLSKECGNIRATLRLIQSGKTTPVRLAALRETGASRHHGSLIEGPLKPFGPSQHYIVLRG